MKLNQITRNIPPQSDFANREEYEAYLDAMIETRRNRIRRSQDVITQLQQLGIIFTSPHNPDKVPGLDYELFPEANEYFGGKAAWWLQKANRHQKEKILRVFRNHQILVDTLRAYERQRWRVNVSTDDAIRDAVSPR